VDNTVFVKVIKAVTDFISEQSGTIGLTAYYEMPEVSNLIQFRIRASRNVTGIDLRTILLDLNINDGGGHPGAIGFRVQKNKISDFRGYVAHLLDRLEKIEIQDKQ
jgi:nanoRNase/pAp phosphatase (c-di-AMP/oligoRNAs hydrolase)